MTLFGSVASPEIRAFTCTHLLVDVQIATMVKISRQESFEALELQESATEDEVRKAYKRLALKW